MIKCKLCGYTSKCRIIEHLVKVHKYDITKYKEQYGPVITDAYKTEVSNRSIKKWKNIAYRTKTNDARNAIWTDEKRKQQSEIIKDCYQNGFKNWSDGLTKETDVRVKKRGENNKRLLSGRTKENYDYLKKHAAFMKQQTTEMWKDGGTFRQYFGDQINFNTWRKNISNTISQLYNEGKLNVHNQFKTGYYKNIFYASSLEMESMMWFDEEPNIKSWRRNFDVIPYTDKNGQVRRYLPDFEVITSGGTKIIIETKGFPDKNLNEKILAAKKKYKHYFVCRSTEEIKTKIYEIINNKENNENQEECI